MTRYALVLCLLATTAAAQQQTLNIGAAPGDGTGDTARDGGAKINANFTELYTFDSAHLAAGDPHAVYLTDAEGDAQYQPLAAVLTATTASFLTADETKLDGIAAGATVGATWGSNVSGQPAVVDQAEAEAGVASTERAWTAQRVGQAIAAFGAALFEADGSVATHAAAGDPHTGYQLESGKNAANGYAGLSAGSLVDPAQLGSGASITTKYLRGDSTWQTLAGGGDLLSSNNLSDLGNAGTARGNLFSTGPLVFSGSNGALFGAGSASASSWPKLTAGTVLTTPEDGAIETDADALYATTDAGNRGYVPVRHFIRADSTRTLPNDANENAIFSSPANGRLTLETGTYLFAGTISVSAMSATSGNALIDIVGAGTATAGSWMWSAWGRDNSSATAAATVTGSFTTTQQSVASIATAATGTGLQVAISGTFEVTGAGTIIPSIDQVTAAAGVVAIGSYLVFERIGSTSVVSVGQWD